MDLRLPATPILDALERRLRQLTSDLAVQPAGAGPWTAYYRRDHLIAFARPAATGPGAAVEISAPAIQWAAVVTDPRSFEDAELIKMLRLAVEAAPKATSRTFAEWGGGPGGGIGAILLAIGMVGTFIDWLWRSRHERAVAVGSGTERELAILNAGRREANARANSLTLGCLVWTGLPIVVAVIAIPLAVVLANIGAIGLAIAMELLVPLAALVAGPIAFASIRRRYPSAPAFGINRYWGWVVLGVLVLMAAACVYGAMRPS